MRPLTARERRLVAVGILLGLIALTWLVVIGPIVGGFAARATERDQLQATYGRNVRIVAALKTWREAAERQRATAPRFALRAANEAAAVTALKERVARLAAQEGATLTALQDLQGDAGPGVVKVRADLKMTLTQLCDAARRLQAEDAMVAVEHVWISADDAVVSGHAGPMTVRLQLMADYG